MFIGHYAAALALKRAEKNASLGLLFLAVQWADLLYFPLVLLGIERIKIIPHFTKSNSLVLEYFPYSHGLLALIIWAGLTYIIFKIFTKNNLVALVMAVAVVSHWFLDLVVHVPDLPLWSDSSPKLGLGLWNYPIAAFLIEAVMLFFGVWLYLGGTTVKTTGGKYGMIIFAVFLLIFNAANFFGPPPSDHITMLAIMSIVTLTTMALVAFWLDKKRA